MAFPLQAVNARWGYSGSYLLESGDLGNVNTAPATPDGGSAKKKETKTMKQWLSAGAAEIKKSGASFFRRVSHAFTQAAKRD